ncbi:MAG: hypothetical protein LBR76_02190 [Oscillospiraceae bacterium]|jgi:sensor histidine kinase YesM|nr:hypothetical protein [Oscillospiraceae bacterium]
MKRIFANMKDVIAVILVFAFCVSIFLPEHLVSDTTMQQFERILFMVVGFYFGTHIAENKNKPPPP